MVMIRSSLLYPLITWCRAAATAAAAAGFMFAEIYMML